MHPRERVRIVVETARAVLDGRLAAEQGAATLELQRAQIGDLLRSDRDAVTHAEATEVASMLRLLGEQVSDADSGVADVDARLVMAKMLGELAQSLR